METSALINDFPPLQSLPLIAREMEQQNAATERLTGRRPASSSRKTI
jgi:hypothetical protein